MEKDSRWILREMVTQRPAVTGTDDAATLARPDADDEGFLRHWIDVVADSDTELARVLAARAVDARRRMDREDLVVWIDTAMHTFDRRGLGAAIAVLEGWERFASERFERRNGLPLDEVSGVLERFVAGLGGRRLELRSAAYPYTDTAAIYVPALLARLPEREENFRLYKAMVAHHWAQTVHGSWRPAVLATLRRFPDRQRALAVFAALERERLDARVARELPGLAREMQWLRAQCDGAAPQPASWAPFAAVLRRHGASAEDSLRLIAAAADTSLPAPACYHGRFLPDPVWDVLTARIDRERQRLAVVLGKLAEEQDRAQPGRSLRAGRAGGGRFQLGTRGGQAGRADLRFELRADGRRLEPPDELRGLLVSMIQDHGHLPPEYLAVSAPAVYDAGANERTGTAPDYHALFDDTGRYTYPEWDHVRGRFRTDYCSLRESDVEPGDPQFVTRTLARHAGLVRSIRRTFEAMVGEVRVVRRQAEGEDVDVDALVEAHVDAWRGVEPGDRVYTRLVRAERNVAVMFMVDMSGSTRGWVNDAEREALVLLCEALETLGDRYAIYGFSGRTHKRCEVYRVKRFDEPYAAAVQARVSGIRPKGYTRMGAAIRHLGHLLDGVPARTKLLVTLSDGKPEDYRSYRGRYGVEDTRHALLEQRRRGIHPYCITIDREGGDYLPHMYGPASYAVIDRVDRLPLRIADIYRRLTS
ncbi:MAG: VWA domain-containing protein [Gammaproteobacteria bacterium]|nr:VWA domain-containing protein [Gammaproteobacteria bacterium]